MSSKCAELPAEDGWIRIAESSRHVADAMIDQQLDGRMHTMTMMPAAGRFADGGCEAFAEGLHVHAHGPRGIGQGEAWLGMGRQQSACTTGESIAR